MKIFKTHLKKLFTTYNHVNKLCNKQLGFKGRYFATSATPIEYTELMRSHTNLKTSYASSTSQFPLAFGTIRELLCDKAKTFTDRVGYVFMHQGVQLTFGELKERVDTAAQNYLNLGFNKGDRIAFVLPNCLELLVLTLAAQEIGLVTTVLNPANQKSELEYMLKKTGAKGLVIYDSFKILQHMKVVQGLCPEIDSCAPGELVSKNLPDLKHVIVLNSPFSPEKQVYKGTWQYSEISEKKSQGVKRDVPYVDLDDPALILFTVWLKSSILLCSAFSFLN